MADYLVQEEDGTSKFTLEDGSGSILLEDNTFNMARVSQDVVEAIVAPTNAKVRVSQDVVEVIQRVVRETVTVQIIDFQIETM